MLEIKTHRNFMIPSQKCQNGLKTLTWKAHPPGYLYKGSPRPLFPGSDA